MANETYIPDAEAGAEEAVQAALEALDTEEDAAYYADLFDTPLSSEQTSEESPEGEEFSVYTNGVARALDNIQRVFPSPLCDLLQNLASFVEDRFGDASLQDLTPTELTQEILPSPEEETQDSMSDRVLSQDETLLSNDASLHSAKEAPIEAIPDETLRQTVTTALTVSPSAFVSELNDTAESLRSGDVSDSFVSDVQNAVFRSASASPVETGDALQLFNDAAKEQIELSCEKGTLEYDTAMDSLSTVMQTMVGTYYGAVLEREASEPLSFAEKRHLDALSLNGVSIVYGEYLPGDDVSVAKDPVQSEMDSRMHFDMVESGRSAVQDGDAPDRLKQSDGASYETEDGLHRMTYEDAANLARTAVASGVVLDASDPTSPGLDSMRASFSETAYGLRQNVAESRLRSEDDALVREEASDGYMTMMRSMQAYNDAAVQSIRETYQDDPEQMQKATDGLANLMRGAVGDAFDLLRDDDGALGFLSEQDKIELDRMRFTGVNVPYSAYWKGMDLKTGELPVEYGDLPVAELEDADPAYSEEDFALYGGSPETESRSSISRSSTQRMESRTTEPAATKQPHTLSSFSVWDSGLSSDEPSDDEDYSL